MNLARALQTLVAHPTVQAVGWTLIHFVWQGASLSVALAIVLAFLRRSSANARYLAACAALVLMAACPIVTYLCVESQRLAQVTAPEPELLPFALGERVGVRGAGEPKLVETTPSTLPLPENLGPVDADARIVSRIAPVPDWTTRIDRALPWLVAAWLIGVVALSGRLLAGWFHVLRIKRRGTRPAADDWQQALARLAGLLRVSRPVRLVESAMVEVPMLIGWLRPVILLPASAIIGLTPAQLESLIAHELAHIRRHDYVVNLFQTVIETLLFYHPAVWWVSHRIRAEREECCDELAVHLCGDRLVYARALATMEELRAPQQQLAVAAHGGSLLVRIGRPSGAANSTQPRSSSPSVAISRRPWKCPCSA